MCVNQRLAMGGADAPPWSPSIVLRPDWKEEHVLDHLA